MHFKQARTRLYAITRPKPTPIGKIKSPCTAIVPYGLTGNANGLRLNQYARNITKLTP